MSNLLEGTKFDEEKIARYDLISPVFLYGTSVVLGHGARKYEDRNWEKGILYHRVYRALIGHLNSWWDGEDNDAEWGCPHLWHAACCLMFLMHYDALPTEYATFDDRPGISNRVIPPQ